MELNVDEVNEGVQRATPTELTARGDSPVAETAVGSRRRRFQVVALLCLIALLAVWNFQDARNFWRAERTHRTLSAAVDGSSQLAPFGSAARAGGRSFDLSNITVPIREIRAGGPPKDGIPALTKPRFVAAGVASYLAPNDRVVGFVQGQDARAYPLKILNYHEIVNDRVEGEPVAITYCPLCDSAAAFDRRTPLGEREFGVSGLLYNSNVLMYDRTDDSESLWSQVMAGGISGPGASRTLKSLPVELTTWSDWRKRFPETKVLSLETGHRRNYDRNPYAGYFDRPELVFPARPTSDRLPVKQRVLGVWTNTAAKAYPTSAFSSDRRRVEDLIGGKRVVVEYVPDAVSLRVAQSDEGVEWMYSLWFAWYAFRPETEVFK